MQPRYRNSHCERRAACKFSVFNPPSPKPSPTQSSSEFSRELLWSGAAAEVDAALGGAIRRLIEHKEFTGRSYETASLLVGVGNAQQALVVGLGKKDRFDAGAAFRCAAAALDTWPANRRSSVAFFLDENWPAEMTESGVCGALVGCTGQDLYRADKTRHPFGTLAWSGGSEAADRQRPHPGRERQSDAAAGQRAADEIYPETFAQRAAEVAAQNGLQIEVWDEQRLETERCGACWPWPRARAARRDS